MDSLLKVCVLISEITLSSRDQPVPLELRDEPDRYFMSRNHRVLNDDILFEISKHADQATRSHMMRASRSLHSMIQPCLLRNDMGSPEPRAPWHAVRHNNVDLLRRILSAFPNVDLERQYANKCATLLGVAIAEGHAECFNVLLEAGAKAERMYRPSWRGYPALVHPLYAALLKNRTEMVGPLLARGACFEREYARPQQHCPALRAEVPRKYITFNPRPKPQDVGDPHDPSDPALQFIMGVPVAFWARSREMVRCLIDHHGVSPDSTTLVTELFDRKYPRAPYQMTFDSDHGSLRRTPVNPLHFSVACRNERGMRSVIGVDAIEAWIEEARIPADARDGGFTHPMSCFSSGRTALDHAAQNLDIPAMRVLLRHGARPSWTEHLPRYNPNNTGPRRISTVAMMMGHNLWPHIMELEQELAHAGMVHLGLPERDEDGRIGPVDTWRIPRVVRQRILDRGRLMLGDELRGVENEICEGLRLLLGGTVTTFSGAGRNGTNLQLPDIRGGPMDLPVEIYAFLTDEFLQSPSIAELLCRMHGRSWITSHPSPLACLLSRVILDKPGSTMLRVNPTQRKPILARWLLENGADPNEGAPPGISPLHWAIYWLDVEMVKLLLEYGADTSSSPLVAYVLNLNLNANANVTPSTEGKGEITTINPFAPETAERAANLCFAAARPGFREALDAALPPRLTPEDVLPFPAMRILYGDDEAARIRGAIGRTPSDGLGEFFGARAMWLNMSSRLTSYFFRGDSKAGGKMYRRLRGEYLERLGEIKEALAMAAADTTGVGGAGDADC